MKLPTNKILLILMKDGSRHTYSVPSDNVVNKIYKIALETDNIDIQDVKEALFFPQTVYNLEDYQYYFDEETKRIEEKPAAIEFKLNEFRKQRSSLFKILDLEFMKALEEDDCKECKSRIVEVKNYLREVPSKLQENLNKLDTKEIMNFDPFNNIFNIKVLNGGSGYAISPEVTISPPDSPGVTGTQMEVLAEVRMGPLGREVVEMHTTVVGSGYTKAPSVVIARPEDPNGNTATAVASSPENDILNITT